MTVGTLQKERKGVLSELLDKKYRGEFSATCDFEKDKKDIYLTSYIVKTISKGKKIVAVLLESRASHAKTMSKGKQNPQTKKLYEFAKGGTNIVDQLNDY